jgi:hypothetical protein
MARVEEYRQHIQNLLREYASYKSSSEDVESQTIFDTEHDHYQLVHAGWNNKRRVYGCVLHLDIKDGKIWIQHDGTEIGIANQLVELGVPKSDIVLAFHSPFKRQFTEFAVG